MCPIGVGLPEQVVEAVLGRGDGLLDYKPESSQARRADGNEQRRDRLDPTGKILEPGPNVVASGKPLVRHKSIISSLSSA